MLEARLIEGVVPATTVEFSYDGRRISGFEGEGISGALMRLGIPRSNSSTNTGAAYYCGMGVCWECVVEVEGVGFVRGCQYPVRAGLVARPVAAPTRKEC